MTCCLFQIAMPPRPRPATGDDTPGQALLLVGMGSSQCQVSIPGRITGNREAMVGSRDRQVRKVLTRAP